MFHTYSSLYELNRHSSVVVSGSDDVSLAYKHCCSIWVLFFLSLRQLPYTPLLESHCVPLGVRLDSCLTGIGEGSAQKLGSIDPEWIFDTLILSVSETTDPRWDGLSSIICRLVDF